MFLCRPVRVFLPLAAALGLIASSLADDPETPAEPTGEEALQAFAQLSQANSITPTVTAEMGDLGGKIFGEVPDPAHTRHYYVAAELDAWDYLPEGADPVCGKPIPPLLAAHHVAMKLRYFQYTDATFTKKVLPNPRLGILGPVLRGVTGETLAITFYNKTDLPLSMHPHGVKYDKDSEGSYDRLAPGRGAAVGPGAKFTYVWRLDEASGPLPEEPSSKCWLYHSHVRGDEETNLGLVGFLIVTDPKRARPDGTPADVDREMASLFMIFNESGFSEADEEAAEIGDAPPEKDWSALQAEREQGNRYAMNGRIYGNLPGLELQEGERVRWYLFALGDETDVHTAHWHGLRVVEEGRRRTDVVSLLPATMKVADMVADNAGSWLYHCHVAEHMQEGMFARVTVAPKGGPAISGPAFFGLREAGQSLQFQRAEVALEPAPGAAAPFRLRLHGKVSVPGAFTIARQPFLFHLGEASARFFPDATGDARAEGGQLHIVNADQNGVVFGEVLEFDATFTSAEWRKALETAGVIRDGRVVPSATAEFLLDLGALQHRCPATFAP